MQTINKITFALKILHFILFTDANSQKSMICSNQIYCSQIYYSQMSQPSNKKNLKPIRSQSELKFTSICSTYMRDQIKSYRVIPSNKNIFESISKIKNHRVNSDTKNINSFHPQLQKKTIENVYRVNKSRSLKELLQMKLRFQEQRIKELKKQSEIRQKQILKNRKNQTSQKLRHYNDQAKQAERSRQIQKSWRQKTLQKQKTQNSFILQTRRESTAMKRRATLTSNKSQRSLIDEKFRQTLRSSKFEEQKRRLERQKQKYQLEYKLSFLKNKSAPKQKLSDDKLYSTLKEKSKKLTEIYSQTQHLPIIPQRKSISRLEKISKTKQAKLQKELVISAIAPKDPNHKNIKKKPLNPELQSVQQNPQASKQEQIKTPQINTHEQIQNKQYIQTSPNQQTHQEKIQNKEEAVQPQKQLPNQLKDYLQEQIK